MRRGLNVSEEEKDEKVTQLKSDLSELRADVKEGELTPADDAERDDLIALIDCLMNN